VTHPGAGSPTALGFVLIIGSAERFARGKQIGTSATHFSELYCQPSACELPSGRVVSGGHSQSRQVLAVAGDDVRLPFNWELLNSLGLLTPQRDSAPIDRIAQIASGAGPR
jgi:hypothetical protein